MMNKSASFNRSTNISGSFRNHTSSSGINASFRSVSARSESSYGGYETPDEGGSVASSVDLEREVDRAIQFMNQVETEIPIDNNANNNNNNNNNNDIMDNTSAHSHGSSWLGDRIDRKKYRPHFKRPKLGKSIMANCFRRYPRCYACTCGIVIPLWILIALCLLCGKFLADFEYEAELDANDAAMRVVRVSQTYDERVSDTIHHLPLLCYMLYRNGTESDEVGDTLATIFSEQDSLADYIEIQPNSTGRTIDNITQFGDFMYSCGKTAEFYSSEVLDVYFDQISVDKDGDTSLSFNWNRCLNRTLSRRTNRILVPNDEDVELSQPEEQVKYYQASWYEDFETKFEENLAIQLAQNPYGLSDYRRAIAFNRSLYEATGRQGCITNVAASAWFWFTIMTTVGYGNQAPSSVGGRAMIFTAGFVCILLFASILATTGTIISHIVFDICYRLKLKFLTRKSVMTIVWGLLWCGWMVFMTGMYMEWTLRRLNGTVTRWQDAYWFAYISTSTVGLGDIYQQPEVLFFNDLFTYCLAYLFGFVLLSTFLTELGNYVAQFIPDLSAELGKRLQHVGVIPYLLDGSHVMDDSVVTKSHPELVEEFRRNGNFSVEKTNEYDSKDFQT